MLQPLQEISSKSKTLFLSVFLVILGFETVPALSINHDPRETVTRDGLIQTVDGPLKQQIELLFAALNHRDLGAIKSQISPTRIYVEISDKTGAYLTNSQTLAVMEAFLRSHSSLSAKFEFDSTEGDNGSASGLLTARRDGRTYTYRLNFGFTKSLRGSWLLTRISMR